MDAESPDTKSNAAIIVGVASLAALVVLVGYLLYRAPRASDTEWSRLVFLLNGIETIAVAAAGFLFGRGVYRARLDVAERRLAAMIRDDARRCP